MSDSDKERAKAQAQAQYDGICDMLTKLHIATDDDAYEEAAEQLARDAGFIVVPVTDGFTYVKEGDEPDLDDSGFHDTEEEAWIACCDDNYLRPSEDDARREIAEDPLSVQVRSDWHSPGEESEDSDFEILLCTGGPAVRIMGELDRWHEPSRAWMEYQDWFTPWVQFHGADQDKLLEYARNFYFGG